MKKAVHVALTLVLLLMGMRSAQASTIQIAQIAVSTTLVGDAIDVAVTNVPGGDDYGLFGDSGGNRSFGFNVVDPDNGVTISNLSAGFSYAGAGVHDMGGGLGDFEFVIDGPHSGSNATLPLQFTVTRTGGFTSDAALYEANALGNVFGLHLKDLNGGAGGFVGVGLDAGGENNAGQLAPVPEPASLLMLGTGMAFLARRLRTKTHTP